MIYDLIFLVGLATATCPRGEIEVCVVSEYTSCAVYAADVCIEHEPNGELCHALGRKEYCVPLPGDCTKVANVCKVGYSATCDSRACVSEYVFSPYDSDIHDFVDNVTDLFDVLHFSEVSDTDTRSINADSSTPPARTASTEPLRIHDREPLGSVWEMNAAGLAPSDVTRTNDLAVRIRNAVINATIRVHRAAVAFQSLLGAAGADLNRDSVVDSRDFNEWFVSVYHIMSAAQQRDMAFVGSVWATVDAAAAQVAVAEGAAAARAAALAAAAEECFTAVRSVLAAAAERLSGAEVGAWESMLASVAHATGPAWTHDRAGGGVATALPNATTAAGATASLIASAQQLSLTAQSAAAAAAQAAASLRLVVERVVAARALPVAVTAAASTAATTAAPPPLLTLPNGAAVVATDVALGDVLRALRAPGPAPTVATGAGPADTGAARGGVFVPHATVPPRHALAGPLTGRTVTVADVYSLLEGIANVTGIFVPTPPQAAPVAHRDAGSAAGGVTWAAVLPAAGAGTDAQLVAAVGTYTVPLASLLAGVRAPDGVYVASSTLHAAATEAAAATHAVRAGAAGDLDVSAAAADPVQRLAAAVAKVRGVFVPYGAMAGNVTLADIAAAVADGSRAAGAGSHGAEYANGGAAHVAWTANIANAATPTEAAARAAAAVRALFDGYAALSRAEAALAAPLPRASISPFAAAAAAAAAAGAATAAAASSYAHYGTLVSTFGALAGGLRPSALLAARSAEPYVAFVTPLGGGAVSPAAISGIILSTTPIARALRGGEAGVSTAAHTAATAPPPAANASLMIVTPHYSLRLDADLCAALPSLDGLAVCVHVPAVPLAAAATAAAGSAVASARALAGTAFAVVATTGPSRSTVAQLTTAARGTFAGRDSLPPPGAEAPPSTATSAFRYVVDAFAANVSPTASTCATRGTVLAHPPAGAARQRAVIASSLPAVSAHGTADIFTGAMRPVHVPAMMAAVGSILGASAAPQLRQSTGVPLPSAGPRWPATNDASSRVATAASDPPPSPAAAGGAWSLDALVAAVLGVVSAQPQGASAALAPADVPLAVATAVAAATAVNGAGTAAPPLAGAPGATPTLPGLVPWPLLDGATWAHDHGSGDHPDGTLHGGAPPTHHAESGVAGTPPAPRRPIISPGNDAPANPAWFTNEHKYPNGYPPHGTAATAGGHAPHPPGTSHGAGADPAWITGEHNHAGEASDTGVNPAWFTNEHKYPNGYPHGATSIPGWHPQPVASDVPTAWQGGHGPHAQAPAPIQWQGAHGPHAGAATGGEHAPSTPPGPARAPSTAGDPWGFGYNMSAVGPILHADCRPHTSSEPRLPPQWQFVKDRFVLVLAALGSIIAILFILLCGVVVYYRRALARTRARFAKLGAASTPAPYAGIVPPAMNLHAFPLAHHTVGTTPSFIAESARGYTGDHASNMAGSPAGSHTEADAVVLLDFGDGNSVIASAAALRSDVDKPLLTDRNR